ncbi:unnamed protein product [Mesocestoides corti]|uniref:Nucleoside phosphorylase domain-containing protein n=1 Tax=Mesocestoides corti TaxID=53468 RepID=A0A3P6I910_MESCO|nr:unnamed protein product [Mesocestoides corti]
MDGAICEYTKEEKMAFLQKAYDLGVRNLEMESLGFAAFCQKLKIKGESMSVHSTFTLIPSVICVTMVNRLITDQITTPVSVMHEWQERPLEILIAYIKKHI